MRFFTTTALTLFALPALAHVGPVAMDLHFIEHLLIALLVAMPTGYGLWRLFSGKKSAAGQ